MKGHFMSMKQKATALVVLGLGVAGQAMAALPTDVTTAVTDAKTDIASAGALVLTVVIALATWRWIGRAFGR